MDAQSTRTNATMARQMLNMLTGADVPELVYSEVGFEVAMVPLDVPLPVVDAVYVTIGKVTVLWLDK